MSISTIALILNIIEKCEPSHFSDVYGLI